MKNGSFFLACCMVALCLPCGAQDLATPVTKVTQMLETMKSKSEKLKTDSDAIYSKAKSNCESTIQTKKDEVSGLQLEITKLDADVMQLKTDIDSLVTEISDDQMSYEQNSKELDYARSTRLKEGNSYQRDLSEYDGALSALQRAVDIMSISPAGGTSFLQAKSSHEAQAALRAVASSMRQLSIYTPDAGGLAKDDKIFEEFKSLTTNSGTYSPGAGKGVSGVMNVLSGLQMTFQHARTQLIDQEKAAKSTFSTTEDNLVNQLETSRTSMSTNKGSKAQNEEALITKRGGLEQASLSKESSAKFLAETESVCEQKKKSYEEMTKLRDQEIVALTKAVDIIKGSVTSNSANLNSKVGKAFVQMHVHGRGSSQIGQHFVKNLEVFIQNEARELHSSSLVRLGGRVQVLANQAPADALAKVKKLIVDLIKRMKQDTVADQWCDDEFTKVKKAKKAAQTAIETHTATQNKIVADIQMISQEIGLLNHTVQKDDKEKIELVAARSTEKAENQKTITEAKESITAVEAAMTLLAEYYKTAAKADDEGSNVIAMLEVVRDGYKTLTAKTDSAEQKAAEVYNSQLTDTSVMIASGESDVKNKKQVLFEYTLLLPQTQADLKASQTALTDAEQNHENLKQPCWSLKDPAKRRKEQLEGEIAALKEAEKMLEAYQGTFLLQDSKGASSISEVAHQVPAGAAQINKVVQLVSGIKADVQKDLESDTKAYNDMQTWCIATISETEAAVKVQRDRDGELMTAIEISTQQKTILTTQLANLNGELAKSRQSLSQMGQLREGELEAFRKAEKETMIAIASLRSAIVVLEAKYASFDKKDKRDYKDEQAQIELGLPVEGPGQASLSLSHVADSVAQALKFLPTGEFNLALSGENGAILQNFLSRPDESMLPGTKQAGLTQMGSELGSNPVGGRTILGILQSLMDTFTADLAAMQGKEGGGIAAFIATKAAKESQISAMETSISTKEGQLAHYTTMNAQAKEDLAYLRETNRVDLQYLQQVRDQCLASQNEFKIRKKSREEELAALTEAVSVLTAGATSSGSGTSAAAAKAAATPPQLLVHTDKHVRHVFVHHHRSQKTRAVLKVGSANVTTPIAQNASAAVPKLKLASAAKTNTVMAPKAAVPVAQKPVVALHGPTLTAKAVLSLLEMAAGKRREGGARLMNEPLHSSLVALESQVKLAHRQLSMGPLTNDAMRSVVKQIDAVVAQLQTEKQLEVQKKDTCVSEKNEAAQNRERRVSDKAKLDSAIIGFSANVKSATDDMAEIATQVQELSSAMSEAVKTRQEEYVAYKATVQDEVNQQKVLNEAIQTLKDFYAKKQNDAKQQAAKAATTKALLLQTAPSNQSVAQAFNTSAPAVTPHMGLQHLFDASVWDEDKSKASPVSLPVPAKTVKLVAKQQADPVVAPTLDRTKDQQALDDAAKKNMDTKWGSVKNVSAKRAEAPKGFEKPLTAHLGGKGIIGILKMILQGSEALIEQDVKDEANSLDLHLAIIVKSKQSIAQKGKETIMLEQVKSENELRRTQAQQQVKVVNTEIIEVSDFILIIDKQCTNFLQNFDANQAARQQEISDTNQAKDVLMGMAEDSTA